MNKSNFKYMLNIYLLALGNQRVKSTLENGIKYQGQVLVNDFELNQKEQDELLKFVGETFERCATDWIINRPQVLGEGKFEYPELSQKAVCLWYVYIIGLQHLRIKVRKDMDKLIETITDEKIYEEVIDATAYDWVVSFLPYEYTYSKTIIDILFKRFMTPQRKSGDGIEPKAAF